MAKKWRGLSARAHPIKRGLAAHATFSEEAAMLKLIFAMLTLALLAATVSAQQAKGKQTVKTIRLHIDGFQKSKSGAV